MKLIKNDVKLLRKVTNSSSFQDINKIDNRPTMREKKQTNILQFISKTKNLKNNENSNNLLNSELINESKHPVFVRQH